MANTKCEHNTKLRHTRRSEWPKFLPKFWTPNHVIIRSTKKTLALRSIYRDIFHGILPNFTPPPAFWSTNLYLECTAPKGGEYGTNCLKYPEKAFGAVTDN